jgi:hypothetical protein
MGTFEFRPKSRSGRLVRPERLIAAGGDAGTGRDLMRLRDLAADQDVSLLRALKDPAKSCQKTALRASVASLSRLLLDGV